MAYAVAADLALLLGQTFDETATQRAQLLLDLASGRIDNVAGQTLSQVADEAITVDGTGSDLIVLPAWPVTVISTVTADAIVLVEGGDYEWSAAGLLWRLDGTWPAAPRSVQVTYTHGYAEVPEVIRSVALNVAAVWWANPSRKQSENIGDYAYRVSSTPNADIDAELERVRAFSTR